MDKPRRPTQPALSFAALASGPKLTDVVNQLRARKNALIPTIITPPSPEPIQKRASVSVSKRDKNRNSIVSTNPIPTPEPVFDLSLHVEEEREHEPTPPAPVSDEPCSTILIPSQDGSKEYLVAFWNLPSQLVETGLDEEIIKKRMKRYIHQDHILPMIMEEVKIVTSPFNALRGTLFLKPPVSKVNNGKDVKSFEDLSAPNALDKSRDKTFTLSFTLDRGVHAHQIVLERKEGAERGNSIGNMIQRYEFELPLRHAVWDDIEELLRKKSAVYASEEKIVEANLGVNTGPVILEEKVEPNPSLRRRSTKAYTPAIPCIYDKEIPECDIIGGVLSMCSNELLQQPSKKSSTNDTHLFVSHLLTHQKSFYGHVEYTVVRLRFPKGISETEYKEAVRKAKLRLREWRYQYKQDADPYITQVCRSGISTLKNHEDDHAQDILSSKTKYDDLKNVKFQEEYYDNSIGYVDPLKWTRKVKTTVLWDVSPLEEIYWRMHGSMRVTTDEEEVMKIGAKNHGAFADVHSAVEYIHFTERRKQEEEEKNGTAQIIKPDKPKKPRRKRRNRDGGEEEDDGFNGYSYLLHDDDDEGDATVYADNIAQTILRRCLGDAHVDGIKNQGRRTRE